MSQLFDTGHVAQLHEIQKARLRRNLPGIGLEVEDLIRRLTNHDPRMAQILRYQELDLFKFLGAKPEDVPAIPERLLADHPHFPHLLLVPPAKDRLLAHLAEKVKINLPYPESKWIAFDARHADLTVWTWIRFQEGWVNHGKSVVDCRKSFAKDELGLTALQGVCGYLQHPRVISNVNEPEAHVMDLPGSVHADVPDGAACLELWDGEVGLYGFVDGYGDDGADSRGGSASRWEC